MDEAVKIPGLVDRLRAARADAGMTQRQAGESSGLSPVLIAKYETGKHTPTLPALYKLAAAYGVTVCDLLPDPPAEKPKLIVGRPVKVLVEPPRPEPAAAPAKPKKGK